MATNNQSDAVKNRIAELKSLQSNVPRNYEEELKLQEQLLEMTSPATLPLADKDPYNDTARQLKLKTQRVPLHLNCPAGAAHEAMAMRDGYIKYGYASFLNKDVTITALDCLGAAMRHIQKLIAGQDYDPSKYGAHHAGHARAMLGIYLECMEQGRLVDDRHQSAIEGGGRDISNMFDRMAQLNADRDSDTK